MIDPLDPNTPLPEPAAPWRDPSKTIGERAVLWSLHEMSHNIHDDAPNSHTGPRIREYLAPCVRCINGVETQLHLIAGNWCAASACAAMQASLLPGETAPHVYRASGLELQTDAINKHGNIVWVQIGPADIGDLLILQRGNIIDPSSRWMRHVCRFVTIPDANQRFKTIGGNEGGRWQLTDRHVGDPDILGVIHYTVAEPEAIQQLSIANDEVHSK